MKRNVSNIDRTIRILLAIVVLGIYAANIFTGIWSVLLLLRAALFFTTGVVAFCPGYYIFKINTQRKAMARVVEQCQY